MEFQLPTPDANDPLEPCVFQAFRKWIPLLGLQNWDIRLRWDDDATKEFEDDPEGHAVVNVSKHYETAKIAFNPEQVMTWTKKEAEIHVVHELLHCVLRDFDFILIQLEGLLHRDVESVITESHRHAIEGGIDRLAYRLVEALECT